MTQIAVNVHKIFENNVFFELLFLYNNKEHSFAVNVGGFTMNNKEFIKTLEIVAGRVMELENGLNVSQQQINRLKVLIEKAENDARK